MAIVRFNEKGYRIDKAVCGIDILEVAEGTEVINEDLGFRYCNPPFFEAVLPESLKEIKEFAFQRSSMLKNVVFKGNLDYLPEGIFLDCFRLESITMPKALRVIKEKAFEDCHSLETIDIPDTVEKIECKAFESCINLKNINFSEGFSGRIEHRAFRACISLEHVDIPDGVSFIAAKAFEDCENLKSISLPDNLSEFPEFISCSKDLVITYKGHSFTKNDMYFIKYLSDGLDDLNCFIILSLQQDILQDDTFSPFLIKKLADAAHNKKLDSLAKRMKNNFQTIGFYEISDKIDAEMKEHLLQLFKKNTTSCGVVPHIMDALTIACTALHIPPEQLVKAFEDKRFRNAIIAMRTCHHVNHFFDMEAVLFALNFDIDYIKQAVLEHPYKDYASALLCEGYKSKKESLINIAKWIIKHPDAKNITIQKLFSYKNRINITPETSMEKVLTLFSHCAAKMEVKRIEDEYKLNEFKLKNCKCNLIKTKVELGKYKAYIMDAKDPRQVMLGYDTCCCQHLGGAGENAMMYGLANPDAGFFVIENKETGKILAQAETWTYSASESSDNLVKIESDTKEKGLDAIEKILVFDNIEFADNRDIDQFIPILAKWCEASPYSDIVMGDGYNKIKSEELRHIEGIEPPYTLFQCMADGIIFPPELCGYDLDDSDDQEAYEEDIMRALYDADCIDWEDDGDYYGVNLLAEYGPYVEDTVKEIIDKLNEKPYTDADESCTILKENGRVEKYFTTALAKQQDNTIEKKHKYCGR